MIRDILYGIMLIIALQVCGQHNGGFDKLIHLTSEEGLSDNSIMAIEKDSEGFMWIGTKNGLNKFDGERFTLFKSIENDTTSLNDNFIRSLESDKDGYLWIGSKEGINRYNLRTKKIEGVHLVGSKKSRIHSIFTICRMRNGNVWFGSPNFLYIYKKKQDQLIEIATSTIGTDVSKNKAIFKIFQDSKDQIWVGTYEGLFRATYDHKGHLALFPAKIANNESQNISVKDITQDAEGNLWIGTENKGLWKYDGLTNLLYRIENEQLANLEIRSLQFDQDENLLIGSFRGLTIRKKDGTVIHLGYLSKTEDPTNDGFKSIFMNTDGSIWIGGYSGGIKIWNKTFNSFSFLRDLSPEMNGNLGLVNSLAEDHLGNIYLGTKKNGISVLDKNKVLHKRLTTILTKALTNVTVKSFAIDQHLLWIATLEKGVLVFDSAKEQFVFDVLSKELRDILEETKVYSIAKSKNKIAIGTLGDGLILYDLITKKINHFSRNDQVEGGTLGNIRVVYFDKRQNLWIGSMTGMQYILADDLENTSNSIKRIKLTKNDKENPSEILSITENHKGQLLIGTGKHGLFIGNEKAVKSIDLTDLKSNLDPVMGIVEDDRHNLWLCTHKEIIKYDPSKEKGYLFDQNYGITKVEFRNQSALHTANNYIYFGTSWGAIYFKPDQLQSTKDSSTVVLTDFKIQGKEVASPLEKQIVGKKGILDQKLVLSHNENSFTINFSSLEFTKILDNTYEYRLVGLHKDWKATTNAEVNYILQKSGDYVFQVRNKRLFGVAENNITSLPIYLKTAPWKSNSAIFVYILCLVLGIFGIYNVLKSKADLKHQLELENLQKIKEKEKHELQIDFFTNLSHDFRTPLTLIIAPLQQLIEDYKGKKIMHTKLLKIKHNANQLLNLVNQLLDFRKIESEKYSLQIEKSNISAFLKRIYDSFEEFSKLGNYNYTFETSSDEIFLYYDSLLVKRVFYNLISNAFKNTKKNGTISVVISEKDDSVQIEVRDTGRGIDEELVNHVFDRFFVVKDHAEYNDFFASGAGIGLHVAKKIIEQHKGTIEVESAKEKGSIFRVYLKKGDLHYGAYTISNNSTHAAESNLNLPALDFETTLPLDLSEFEIEQKSNQFSILVIEDNKQMRRLIVDLLKKNYAIEQASYSTDGYSKIVQKRIDLIICDVAIPGISGTELCKKIKNDIRTSYIPFILLTSQYSSSQKIEGLRSGADAYLTKPFLIQELLFTVKNLLQTNKQAIAQYDKDGDIQISNLKIDLEDEKLYKKALKVIYENLGNSSFEMDSFSSELGISRRQLYRKIKNWTNQTPNEFLQTVRLQKASELLEIGGLTIAEISYEVGFGNPQYFAKCFKKQFHKTPSEYANQFYND